MMAQVEAIMGRIHKICHFVHREEKPIIQNRSNISGRIRVSRRAAQYEVPLARHLEKTKTATTSLVESVPHPSLGGHRGRHEA